MNLFTRNSPYYHLLKYLLFLLNHPVYTIAMFAASGLCYIWEHRTWRKWGRRVFFSRFRRSLSFDVRFCNIVIFHFEFEVGALQKEFASEMLSPYSVLYRWTGLVRNVLILCRGLMHNPREYVSHWLHVSSATSWLYVVPYKRIGFLIFELEPIKNAPRK
jgi:hypothetical protein